MILSKLNFRHNYRIVYYHKFYSSYNLIFKIPYCVIFFLIALKSLYTFFLIGTFRIYVPYGKYFILFYDKNREKSKQTIYILL